MWLAFTLLSSLGWSFVNVLDSLLVRRYEKSSVLLMWSQSLFSIPALVFFALAFTVDTDWWMVLLLAGCTAFLADLTFFKVLDFLDVSIVNAGWAILGIYLALAGFIFFGERWTLLQTAGCLLILLGVFLVSFWHAHVSLFRTVLILSSVSLLYTPTYVLKKAALLSGADVFPVFFWLILGREMLAFSYSLLHPSYRRRIPGLFTRERSPIFFIGGIVIVSFFLGEYFGTRSFDVGPISLIAVVSNVQMFMILGLAWLLWNLWPAIAPRELVTRKSVGIKLVSFCIVFLGLALLAFPS